MIDLLKKNDLFFLKQVKENILTKYNLPFECLSIRAGRGALPAENKTYLNSVQQTAKGRKDGIDDECERKC